MTGDPERDQTATIALLGARSTYGDVAAVERIDTHISHVFLAGSRVYKLKRAVRFPYLDFTSRAARHAACEAEVRRNRRTAPELYLGVAPVLRAGSQLRLGAPGETAGPGEEAVDWTVAMRRFDQAALLDSLAMRGELTPGLVTALADAVAAFHAHASPTPGFGGAEGMRHALDGILSEIARLTPSVFEAAAAEQAACELRSALSTLAPLLDRRAAQGFVREAHGDLHLRNIYLFDGRPVLFDSIEFSDAIANIDVLYDVAFLVMDLEYRKLHGLANHALNEYLQRTGDYAGLAAMPFFLACRAMIRAHVAGTQASQSSGSDNVFSREARAYFELGLKFLKPVPPRLIAVGGPSGTGKTVLSIALAPLFGRPPGAIHLRSDMVRKKLFGVDPLTRLGPDAYAEPVTRQVYETVRQSAIEALGAGFSVIADAVYGRAEERAGIAAAARMAGARFDGIWLSAPEETRIARVESRRSDASDADAAVARSQTAFIPAETEWLKIDASRGPDQTAAQAGKALNFNEKHQTLLS